MHAKMMPVVDYFSIVGGVWKDPPTGIGIAEPSARVARRKGNLYVLVECLEADSSMDTICQDVAATVENSYYRSSGSVTGGLLAGIRAANAQLFEHNQGSPQGQRVYAGVSCVLLKESDLFIAQAGPALVYLIHDESVARHPGDSPWLESELPKDPEAVFVAPLGVRKEIEPDLHHNKVQIGDHVVLTCSSLVRTASESQIARVLSNKGAETVGRALERFAEGGDLSAVVLELGEEPSAARKAPALALGRRRLAATERAETEEEVPAAVEVVVEPEQPPSDLEEEELAAPIPPAEAEVVEEEEQEEEDQEEEEWEEEDREPLPSASIAGAAEGAKRGFRKAGSMLVTTLKRVLPEPGAAPKVPRAKRDRETPRVSTRTLIIISLLIPALVAALVVITRYQYEQTRRNQHGDYLVEARLRMTEALGASDKEMVRAGLAESLELVNQALQLDSEDEKALDLWWEIQDHLDAINQVSRLYTFWSLARLQGPSGQMGKVGRILVRGSEVYLLDCNADQVLGYRLNEVGDGLVPDDDPLLIRKEDQLGDIVVDDLVEMIWMPAGGARQSSNLLVLERGGSLLEHTPGAGIRVYPVANAAEWRKVQAAGAYRGNFYVLDPVSNRILKYVPGVEGYTSPPEEYISSQVQVDLGGAVDMTIDGHVYVLLADGRVLKFLSGDLKPFSMAGLDTALRNPSAIFAAGDMDGGHIYVADTGNRRVVQFDKEGVFLRQFKAAEGSTDMDQLRGLFVDEERGRLFLINANSLLLTGIPVLGGAP